MAHISRLLLGFVTDHLSVNEMVRCKAYLINKETHNKFIARYKQAVAGRASLIDLCFQSWIDMRKSLDVYFGPEGLQSANYKYTPKWIKDGDIIKVSIIADSVKLLFVRKLVNSSGAYEFTKIRANPAKKGAPYHFICPYRGEFIDIVDIPNLRFYRGIFKFRPNYIDLANYSATRAKDTNFYFLVHKTSNCMLLISSKSPVTGHYYRTEIIMGGKMQTIYYR